MTDSKVISGGEVNFATDANPKADVAIQSQQAAGSSTTYSTSGTGLDAVPEEAVMTFATEVAGYFNVDQSKALFFAYLFQPRYNTSSGTKLEFCPSPIMSGADALEVIKRLCGANYTKTDILSELVRVNPKNPSQLEQEVDFPISSFPEAGRLFQQFERYTREDQPSSPYFDLMKVPPRGKTFFAGVLHNVQSQQGRNFTNNPSKLWENRNIIDLQISARDIVDYAALINLHDVSTYLRMLGEGK